MTQASTPASEMDHLDQLGAKAFDDFLVRKDLVRKDSRQYPVATDVVEFLLSRYCASTDPAEIEEGLEPTALAAGLQHRHTSAASTEMQSDR